MSQFSYEYSKKLKQLRKAIVRRPPYCSGFLTVREDQLSLYYGRGENACQLNFKDASEDALKRLFDACTPAQFGRNDEKVFDESYRKAGELNNDEFAVKLNVEQSGLMSLVRNELLEGWAAQRTIQAELYKLNVYGEGSFFKSHKDTPRGANMFGSLVVIYPTHHTGGSLVFRDRKDEWTFKSEEAVDMGDEPCIAYAAFFSDVDHEVALVQSGYRVSVTYNLYFAEHPEMPDQKADRLKFRSVLETLLADPKFLPDGGRLGFGLQRVYPLEKKAWDHDALDYLKDFLKGSDAEIMRVCKALSLKAKLKMLYRTRKNAGLVSREPLFDSASADYSDDDLLNYIRDWQDRNVKEVNDFSSRRNSSIAYDSESEDSDSSNGSASSEIPAGGPDSDDESTGESEYTPEEMGYDCIVHWVTKPSGKNVVKATRATYGNEPDLDYTYGFVTLIAEVGKPGERATMRVTR
ncbi:hypothetical protein NM688_g6673 [Phlebia brevispora]|uniref:Uncharacterized protein n=1 Tax=Phlebia brevispora TaxID=194682 RepID=A0ACC1SDT0_9APHY|nr:hypothetical protein NM688_g6673 [Phlebia brevispora]